MAILKLASNFFQYLYKFGIFRGLKLAFEVKFAGTDLLHIKLHGISNPFSLRRKTSDIETFHQVFFYEEYAITFDFEPKVVIDGGANIGLAAIYFANRFKYAKIYSFEPEEGNFKLLSKNTSFYENILPFQLALSNLGDQEISVIDEGYGDWGFITQKPSSDKHEKIKNSVKTISINDIVVKHELKQLDIVKIDIEGFEKELFSSNIEWLDITRCLIVELHDRMVENSSKTVFQALLNYDFSFDCRGENLIFTNKKFQ